jgi:hypothetical protein
MDDVDYFAEAFGSGVFTGDKASDLSRIASQAE